MCQDRDYSSRARRLSPRSLGRACGARGGGPGPRAGSEFWRRSCVNETGLRNGAHGADKFGFKDLAGVHWNLGAEQLYEYAIAAKEGHVVEGGAFCAETGIHTGRSPKDKFVVCDALDREDDLVGEQRQARARAVRGAARRLPRARQGQAALRRRTSTAAPIRSIASRRASSPNSPGTRCSSARC